MRRRDRGFALIEVLAALIVLGLAGLALVQLAGGTLDALARSAEAERRMLDEERLLTAHTLLDRRDLERRLGRRIEGAYAVTIRREALDLFVVGVGPRAGDPELVTSVYRPEVGSSD